MSGRYLASFDTRRLGHETVDVLVIGTGVAGLTAAITAARRGASTLMVNKAGLGESNTSAAKGGIAAAIHDDDRFDLHARDTLAAGDGLCDEETVRACVEAAPRAVAFLQSCGARFDMIGDRLDLGREGGHSGHRIVHAGGDATGREVSRSLLATRARDRPPQGVLEHLRPGSDRSRGALRRSGHRAPWRAARRMGEQDAVLAAGGAGQLYRESSNPAIATGDGHAMALRAGAVMRDMEMVQFHPTLLYVAGLPRWLITEALRGHGAYLRNSAGHRFMEGVHEMEELAPRNVVARAINRELRRTGRSGGLHRHDAPRPDGAAHQVSHLHGGLRRGRYRSGPLLGSGAPRPPLPDSGG